MTHARSTRSPDAGFAAVLALIDGTPIRTDGRRPGQGPGTARELAGYDEVDVRMLEWIASHRRARPTVAA